MQPRLSKEDRETLCAGLRARGEAIAANEIEALAKWHDWARKELDRQKHLRNSERDDHRAVVASLVRRVAELEATAGTST